MKKYSVRYTPRALDSIKQIFRYIYIDLQNPFAATRTYTAILRKCESLALLPLARNIRLRKDDLEIRIANVKKYAILYTVDEKRRLVKILEVAYAARDIKNITNRL